MKTLRWLSAFAPSFGNKGKPSCRFLPPSIWRAQRCYFRSPVEEECDPPPPSPAPKPSGRVKKWVKKHLQALGQVLTKLAGKAAAAPPGIIGSVVSWILSMLGKTTLWLAENLWAAALLVVGLIVVAGQG